MRTIAYVDGYNLYYGCLKHTSYLWLDVHRLISDILRAQDPAIELVRVKYFTAHIKARFASNGEAAAQAQQAYFKALRASGRVDVITGDYSLEPSWAVRYREPPDKADRVQIWRFEEKRTDVNLSLSAYRDVAKGLVDQVVFVTNDSDIAPAVEAIREDFPDIRIGVVFPISLPEGHDRRGRRPPCADLARFGDWTRRYIRSEELEAAQFPAKVATRKKPAIKPGHW